MKNLILIRHGQSTWNLEKRFTGWADIDLTDQGISEAHNAGKLIKDLNLEYEICFSSILKRAYNTLEIILKIIDQKNLKYERHYQLNERHYGALTGLNKNDMKKKYGEKKILEWRRSWNISPPSHNKELNKYIIYPNIQETNIPRSESLEDTYKRIVPFYEKNILPLLKKDKNIIVAAHGNSLRALMKNIFNISNNKIFKLEIPTGNPLLISFDHELKIIKYVYLDKNRAKELLCNV